MELPARASSSAAAVALCDSEWRRPAERCAAERSGLVLLPGDRLSAHQRAVGDWRPYGYGCGHDDGHEVGLDAGRYGVAGALQQAYCGRDDGECEARWASGVVG